MNFGVGYMHIINSAGRMTNEFLNRTKIFMYQTGNASLLQEIYKIFCPCRKCNNTKFSPSEMVWKHIVNREYTPHYYIWFHHGKGDSKNEVSSSNQFENVHNRD